MRRLSPILLLLVLAACEVPFVYHPLAEPLRGTRWELTAYRIADGPVVPVVRDPTPSVQDGPYVVRFLAEGSSGGDPFPADPAEGLTGSTGCNNFRAAYRTSGRALSVYDFAITLQACGNATEAVFVQGLVTALTWEVDDDTLRIVYDHGVSELFLTRD